MLDRLVQELLRATRRRSKPAKPVEKGTAQHRRRLKRLQATHDKRWPTKGLKWDKESNKWVEA